MDADVRIVFIDMPASQDYAWYPDLNTLALPRRIEGDEPACERAIDRAQGEWRRSLPALCFAPRRTLAQAAVA